MTTPNEEIVVVARCRGKAGREAELDAALQAILAPTRAEDGCLTYDMHRILDDSGQEPGGEWLFHERWKSRAALDEHMQREHMTAFFAKAHDLVEGDVDITIWRKAD